MKNKILIAQNEFVWGREADEEREKAELSKEQKPQQSTSGKRRMPTENIQASEKVRKLVKVTIQERIALMVTLHRKGMKHKQRNKRKRRKRPKTKVSKMHSLIILMVTRQKEGL